MKEYIKNDMLVYYLVKFMCYYWNFIIFSGVTVLFIWLMMQPNISEGIRFYKSFAIVFYIMYTVFGAAYLIIEEVDYGKVRFSTRWFDQNIKK